MMDHEKFKSAFEVLQEHQRMGLKKGFCHVPFTTLILEPDGKVGSCRMKGCEFPVGNILESSLEEIWNGKTIREWRRQHLDGKPKFCENEIKHDACNLCPDYNWLLDKTSLSEIQNKKPLRLALNFNGKCNLECVMCHIWQKPNGLYDKIGFWDKLEDYTRDLQEIELLSGEPFLQKDTYRLIDIVSKSNPNCLWTITTNCHWKLTDGIKAALDKIRIRHLIISIDSVVPETYAKIRKKGDLSVVLENFDRILEYEKERIVRGLGPLTIRANFLYQKDNAFELKDSHHFEKTKGVRVFRTLCYEPIEVSILSMTDSERDDLLTKYFSDLDFDELSQSMRVVLPILESLPPLSRAHHLEHLKTVKNQ